MRYLVVDALPQLEFSAWRYTVQNSGSKQLNSSSPVAFAIPAATATSNHTVVTFLLGFNLTTTTDSCFGITISGVPTGAGTIVITLSTTCALS